MSSHCPDLKVVGADGKDLGDATSNQFAPNGVCNTVGIHGSTVSPTSIYDSVGVYGSTVSPLSAYSTITSTPPELYCVSSDQVVAAVSKNTIILGAIDPDKLCDVLAANGY
jgi:hypothetical protein